MKKILIIGASGFVGVNLAVYLRQHYRIYGTYSTRPPQIDGVPLFPLTIKPGVPFQEMVKNLNPDAVVYCSAMIDNQQCEKESALATYVNAEAPYLLARVLQDLGSRFIYFSTSKVFAGETGSYAETDETDPQGIYGISKVKAEDLLLRLSNTFILRLGTVFGLGTSGQHASILNRMLNTVWESQELSLIDDEVRSFLAVDEICRAVGIALDAPMEFAGLYHLSPPEKNTYFTFGQKLVEVFQLFDAKISPLSGAKFAGKLAAAGGARGNDLSLIGDLFAKTFRYRYHSLDLAMRNLRDQLRTGTQ